MAGLRAPRRGSAVLRLSVLLALVWAALPGTGKVRLRQGFVPPWERLGAVLRPTGGAVKGAQFGAAAAGAALGSQAAYAEDGGNVLQTITDIVTKGSTENNDPTTEEGAKAMGLAFPIPKNEEMPKATVEDALPFIGVLVAAIVWGVLIVPNLMDRADGSKTVYFPEKDEDDDEEVDKTKVVAEAPVIKVKRAAKREDTTATEKITTPKRTKPKSDRSKKKRVGFAAKK